jgi:hypothetical protein
MKSFLICSSVAIFASCAAQAKNDGLLSSPLVAFQSCIGQQELAKTETAESSCLEKVLLDCEQTKPTSVLSECLDEFTVFLRLQSLEIQKSLPATIQSDERKQRDYERKLARLNSGLFGVCDASPREEIPLGQWCDFYLIAGDWMQLRHLQRLALEVEK